MQNTVAHCIRNGFNFFALQSVTCSGFGNYPTNGLVTEVLQ